MSSHNAILAITKHKLVSIIWLVPTYDSGSGSLLLRAFCSKQRNWSSSWPKRVNDEERRRQHSCVMILFSSFFHIYFALFALLYLLYSVFFFNFSFIMCASLFVCASVAVCRSVANVVIVVCCVCIAVATCCACYLINTWNITHVRFVYHFSLSVSLSLSLCVLWSMAAAINALLSFLLSGQNVFYVLFTFFHT